MSIIDYICWWSYDHNGGRVRQRWRMRFIGFKPQVKCFKPCGMHGSQLESVVLGFDELEALRLADYEGLYQEECASKMNISRTTFGRTIESARKKIADCLINGKILIIQGGDTNEDSHTNQ